jgi:hypothetical protein
VEALVAYLRDETEEYVWMDQFCVPQPGPSQEVRCAVPLRVFLQAPLCWFRGGWR